MPKLHDNIKYILSEKNCIEKLSYLPTHLVELNISYNRIEHLPKLPETLQYLYISNNLIEEIQKLPRIPPKLKKLYSSHNEQYLYLNYL